MRGGYSTSEETADAFIKSSHIMATIRSKPKKKNWHMQHLLHIKR